MTDYRQDFTVTELVPRLLAGDAVDLALRTTCTCSRILVRRTSGRGQPERWTVAHQPDCDHAVLAAAIDSTDGGDPAMTTPAPPRRGSRPASDRQALDDDRARDAAAALLATVDALLTQAPGRVRARQLLHQLAGQAEQAAGALRRTGWSWAELRSDGASQLARSGQTMNLASAVVKAGKAGTEGTPR